jgi:hypothetical protein
MGISVSDQLWPNAYVCWDSPCKNKTHGQRAVCVVCGRPHTGWWCLHIIYEHHLVEVASEGIKVGGGGRMMLPILPNCLCGLVE